MIAVCKHCQQRGEIKLVHQGFNEEHEPIYTTVDKVRHLPWCPKYRYKPKHLKSKNWRREEKKAQELFNVRPTAASGAYNNDNDGRKIHDKRIEVKTTKKDSYRLNKSLWTDFVRGALASSEEPFFIIYFKKRTLIVARESLFKESFSEIKTNNKSVTINEMENTPARIDLEPTAVLLTQKEYKEYETKLHSGNNL